MKIGSIELPPIPHATTNEKLIVGRLVADLLAAGMTITIWNGGETSELENCTDAAKIFAELAASDTDELTLEDANGYAGWIMLVWGNDHEIIANYSTRLESILAPAEQLAEELGDAPLPSYEEALLDPMKARFLFDASKGGNVRGITEDHRFQLARVFGVPKRPNLISIEALTKLMTARGWRVHGSSRYAECFAPDHQGPGAVWHHGSQYSTCTTSLYDKPRSGYGYNDWFHGPWHFGMIQRDDYAVKTILSHPSMVGVEI